MKKSALPFQATPMPGTFYGASTGKRGKARQSAGRSWRASRKGRRTSASVWAPASKFEVRTMKIRWKLTVALAAMIAVVTWGFSFLQLHPASPHMYVLKLLAEALLISIATLLIVRWSLTDLIRRSADWIEQLRLGEEPDSPAPWP